MWLAASGDQRVSVWASDWLRDRCELVDWLSFPAPTLMEVRVLVAPWAGGVPAHLATACCTPPQAPGCLPPSLAAFCPWDKALLVCAGLGPHLEVVFYSLRQKQACTCPLWYWEGGSWGPWEPLPSASHLLPTGGGQDPSAFLCRVPQLVPRGPPPGYRLRW